VSIFVHFFENFCVFSRHSDSFAESTDALPDMYDPNDDENCEIPKTFELADSVLRGCALNPDSFAESTDALPDMYDPNDDENCEIPDE
jgi:hypothetical protein